MARTALVASAVVAGAVACAVVLVRAQLIVLALLGAIVFAEALRPLVDWLTSRVPRGAAIALAFAAVLLVGGVVWLLPLRELAPQFGALWSAVLTFITHYGPRLPTEAAPAILNAFLTGGRDLTQNLSMVGLSFVMALFWFGASNRLRVSALSLAPPQRRADLDALFADLGDRLRLYVIGTLINGAIVGLGCGFGLAWIRFPYPLALAVLQPLLVPVPYLGTFVGVALAGGVAFSTQGPIAGAEAAGVVAVVHTLEGTFVAPLIFQRRLDVDPLAVLLATAIGGLFFGIPGVALARGPRRCRIANARRARSRPLRLLPP